MQDVPAGLLRKHCLGIQLAVQEPAFYKIDIPVIEGAQYILVSQGLEQDGHGKFALAVYPYI